MFPTMPRSSPPTPPTTQTRRHSKTMLNAILFIAGAIARTYGITHLWLLQSESDFSLSSRFPAAFHQEQLRWHKGVSKFAAITLLVPPLFHMFAAACSNACLLASLRTRSIGSPCRPQDARLAGWSDGKDRVQITMGSCDVRHHHLSFCRFAGRFEGASRSHKLQRFRWATRALSRSRAPTSGKFLPQEGLQ